jgi:hypothetical protein
MHLFFEYWNRRAAGWIPIHVTICGKLVIELIIVVLISGIVTDVIIPFATARTTAGNNNTDSTSVRHLF